MPTWAPASGAARGRHTRPRPSATSPARSARRRTTPRRRPRRRAARSSTRRRNPRAPASATDTPYLPTYASDAKGHRTPATAPLGRVTTTAYTDGTTVAAADGGFAPAGLPTTVTTPSGVKQSVVYFRSGDVATVTDPA